MLRLGRKPVQMLNRKISARIPHPSALWADAYELWYDCPGNHRFFGFAAGRTTLGESWGEQRRQQAAALQCRVIENTP